MSVKRVLAAVVVAGAFAVGACTEDTVIVERPPFNPAPDAASGFLGYYTVDTVAGSQTTCGNCHASFDANWKETAHADAWNGLQGSGHAASFCEGCHAVSENGNVVDTTAGINALDSNDVNRAVYYDVQCESCHGPGTDHAASPTSTYPLASIQVAEGGCGECHQGTHHPFVEQWAVSNHAIGSSLGRGSREGCDECHSGQGALDEQFGENGVYLEKGDGETYPITCIVCHDPHGGPHEGQLRRPLADESTPRQLCVSCHNRRTVPEAGGTHGAHGAQAAVLLAENVGWWPDGLEWNETELAHEHGDTDINPRLCGTCHVVEEEIEDPVTGGTVHSVGHTFEATPCLAVDGTLTDPPCANEPFLVCDGCHLASETKMENLAAELTGYLKSLWDDVNLDNHMDWAGPDTGLLMRIIAQEGVDILNLEDTVHTVAEGILFNTSISWTHDADWFSDGNLVLAPDDTLHFSAHPTAADGVHNPTFLREILKASLAMGASFYGVSPPAGIDLRGAYTLPKAWAPDQR
jgi:predicted CXXCH cytochrome family protein